MHNYLIASLMCCCTCPQTRFILFYTDQLVHYRGAWVAMAMFISALSNITKLENKHTYIVPGPVCEIQLCNDLNNTMSYY